MKSRHEHDHDYDHEDYDHEPTSRRPRRKSRSRIWLTLAILTGTLVGGGLLYFSAQDGRNYDIEAFCRQARRLNSVELQAVQSAPEGERPAAVRSAAARLILINEQLAQFAPSRIQGDLESLIEGYRAAVRSSDFAELQALEGSGERAEVARLVASDCG